CSGEEGAALEARIYPTDVAADSAGNLYIADAKDEQLSDGRLTGYRARKVDTPGYISVVAGTGEKCTSDEETCGNGGPVSIGFPARNLQYCC
ncbi:MAG: hypothetical protein GY795_02085, partial [Desulfobacterales bacterium]|nr:hypothetical protein [Desulfobacterales bacterium]